jgi:predicted alpha/beta-hydrolase family hydrolase
MHLPTSRTLKVVVNAEHTVSALYLAPRVSNECYVFAHGAGAGKTHPFMTDIANGLAARQIASLRYQFPYMEEGSRRPDRPLLAHATVLAAVRAAARLGPRKILIAGGKSFGARMTSQAQAIDPLPKVRGLAFLGFPLHPAKKPAAERAAHLSGTKIPMLFIQGDRDALAEAPFLLPTVKCLGPSAALKRIKGADHSFHVLVRSGRTNTDAFNEVLDDLASWIKEVGNSKPRRRKHPGN